MPDNTPPETDGYYDEDYDDNEELDLSFLDKDNE